MSSRDYVLAIDIGTTSTKVLAVSPAGEVLAESGAAYPLHSPSSGRAELDPDEVLNAVESASRRVVGEAGDACAATVFGAFMHGLIAVGDRGEPLSTCWTWADQRAAPQAERLHEEGVASELHARTGTPVHAMSPLCKLLWMREHEPATFGAARRFVSIKEYVMRALCDDAPVDHSIASASGLFELRRAAWDDGALGLVGLDAARLATLVPTRHVVAARRGGPLPAAPVVIGASDGTLANLGAGAIEPGVVAVTLGTSGAARAVVGAPTVDPASRLFCYVLDEGCWVVGGAIQNAGLVVRWLGQLLGVDALGVDGAEPSAVEALERLVARAAEVAPGADGLLCLPLIAGERFAAWRPDASGMFAGLTRRHDARHLTRAVFEGILCCIGTVVRAVEDFTEPAREVRFGGGFARSPQLRQMLADVLGCRVAMPSSEQSSALGAARLAWEALGSAEPWRDEVAFVHEPDPAAAAVYARVAELQRELYARNEDLLGELAEGREAATDG